VTHYWLPFVVVFLLSTSLYAQKTRVNPDGSKPDGFSQLVISEPGKTVYISGQVPVDANGLMADPNDFEKQVIQVYKNLQKALETAGADFSDLVKINIYIVDYTPEKLAVLRKIRKQFVPEDAPPATTLLGVEKLYRVDVLLEIDAVAIIH
jgi:enamine deaminase RidA (YjgF/YER057c/UK114 family)